MRTALHVSSFDFPGGPDAIAPTLAGLARTADDGGLAALTLMDHYFQMESQGDARDRMLEGYTSLGYLAGVTERLRLGLLVTGVTYRHPGLLAKIVATLDVLSGGRAMLGIGAAWYEREHHALGVPFPPLKERFERLEEALQVCEQMWSDDDGPYEGRHYRLAETVCTPRPLQQPRPTVVIGGMGERKTLRLVAEHADACNLFDTDPETVAHKIEVLRRHCDDVGRDASEVAVTIVTGADPFDDAFLPRMAQYAEVGVEQVWLGFGPDAAAADPQGWVDRVVTDVAPRVADL